jgi:hypothetical protein
MNPRPCARQGHSNIHHGTASRFDAGLVRTLSLVFVYNPFVTIAFPHILDE